MATTPTMNLTIIGPDIFDGDNSRLETFIKDFDRYSQFMEIAETRKILMVTLFLTTEAIEKYEAATGKTYANKLRAAFAKKKNILDIMSEIINLKIGTEDPEKMFKIVY